MTSWISRRHAVRGVLPWLAALPAAAPADQDTTLLDPIVVVGNRIGRPDLEQPAAIDVVPGARIRDGQWQVNVSESLVRVPGLHVQNRQAYAQDLQVSSRGFGARAQFGVRGVRIIADDIPATMPDGQGQTGGFDLASAERIEVLRGPYSALYGNHSGGVVQLFTEAGPSQPTLAASQAAGSHASWRSALKFGGQHDRLNYLVDASRFATAGYRDHSAARRDQFHGKFRVDVGDDTRISLVADALDQPENQDPLGLTAAQVRDNPRQATGVAKSANTRRSLRNGQGGLVAEQALGAADTLRLIAYAGNRQNEQFLPVPANPAAVIKGSGGDSVIARDFAGTGLRWTRRSTDLILTTGLDWDHMKDVRTGYDNNGGQRGVLRRDEDNRATAAGLYAQAEWQATPDWSLSGGLRASRVDFAIRDRYIKSAINPDDSGNRRFTASTPVLGASYRLAPAFHLYAAAGRSFETPTLVEMAYRPDGGAGINLDLRPSRSNNLELGAKALLGPGSRSSLALFHIDTRDEIVVAGNDAGRSSYRNASRSARRGIEASLDSRLARDWQASLAYTYLDASFAEAFRSCQTAACPVVPAGNRLPGVPRESGHAELAWKAAGSGLASAIEARYVGPVPVNDANTEAAAGHLTAHWRIGIERPFGDGLLKAFLRIDNLADKAHVGAVYVGDANGRYYAPAPGRTWLLGLSFGLRL